MATVEMPDHFKSKLVSFHCTCGEPSHMVSFQAEYDSVHDNHYYVDMWVADETRQPQGTWNRLKALYYLWAKGYYTHAGVRISRNDLIELKELVDRVLLETETGTIQVNPEDDLEPLKRGWWEEFQRWMSNGPLHSIKTIFNQR